MYSEKVKDYEMEAVASSVADTFKNKLTIRNASNGVFLGCSGYSLPGDEQCKKTLNLISGDEAVSVDSSTINFQKSLHWGLLDPDNGLQDPCPVMDKIEFNENSL